MNRQAARPRSLYIRGVHHGPPFALEILVQVRHLRREHLAHHPLQLNGRVAPAAQGKILRVVRPKGQRGQPLDAQVAICACAFGNPSLPSTVSNCHIPSLKWHNGSVTRAANCPAPHCMPPIPATVSTRLIGARTCYSTFTCISASQVSGRS